MNPRILLALGVSAGMALLVSAIFYQIAVREREPTEDTATKEVVIAARDLNVGSIIADDDLRVEMWPANKLADDVFIKLDEMIGRVPINKILSDEPIPGRRLADVGSGFGLAPKVTPGLRAMSVRVNDVIGISGFVLPEARVDVLVTGVPRGHEGGGTMTKTILSNMRVISAGQNLEPDASGKPERVAVVTLLVSPEQAELLTLAASQGRLQLVLRNSSDQEVTEIDGVREPEVFAGKIEPPTPPPPPIQLEVIRGNSRSIQEFGATAVN
jgi:pilus assembly protein CpaB